jgi:hypothetical protein
LSLAAGGALATGRLLARRHRWEQQHNQVAICVDYDDGAAAAIRAGLPLDTLLERIAAHGATHLSLPELTLNRLRWLGQLAPQAPAITLPEPPAVGHWNYLHGRPELVRYLAGELGQRLPYTQAQVVAGHTLAFAGDLPTIGEIGLGFDGESGGRIRQAGLEPVPRPVSYAWPEKALLERTLAQAASHGSLIAFAGEMILGHEMHLEETLAAMARQGLSLVFFVESRHQKGDWFVAKRRAPHVILAHRFTAEEMIPLDFHAAAHNWAHLARERGIRFCYVNFFRVLHATAPLEGLHYLAHLKEALEGSGFVVTARPALPQPVPAATPSELAAAGVAAAGVGAAAIGALVSLPEAAAVPLVLAGAGGAAALPFVERARYRAITAGSGHHHHDHDSHDHDHHHHEAELAPGGHDHSHDHGDPQALYPPSYAPKLLGLVAAALGPIAGGPPHHRAFGDIAGDGRAAGWLASLIYPVAAAAALAAATSSPEYYLRIEEYRGLNLDWLLPLSASALALPGEGSRLVALALLGTAWLVARKRRLDPLAAVDPGHAMGHTHHISAAQRLVGDAVMAFGPQPSRKWAGLGPAAAALSPWLRRRGRPDMATAAAVVSALGNAFVLVGYRRPERALAVTSREATPSFAAGAALGLLLLILGDERS